jgi:DNA-binding NarL/FixJ family response regulator
MASEGIKYSDVLADLEAKKAVIDAMITNTRQMLNLGLDQLAAAAGSVAPTDRTPTEVRTDTFFRMTMPDAIIKYLEIAKRPQTLSEITKALQDGGLPTTATNLMPIVGSRLSRLKTDGKVCQPTSGKWGLSEWYPAAARQAAAAAKAKTRRRGRPKKSKTPPQPKPTEKPAVASKSTPEQIERIKALHAAGRSNGEIGKELGISNLTVWRTLKPLVAKAS